MSKILIVEPSKSVRKPLCELIELEGITTQAVEDALAAEAAIVSSLATRTPFDMMIYGDSLSALDGALSSLPFIYMSTNPSIEEAMVAARKGAVEYLTRPINSNQLITTIRDTIERINRDKESPSKMERRRTTQRLPCKEMVGISEKITKLRLIIDKVAPSDARVMILGENGTGKELVARAIHAKSHRSSAPLIEVNCAAIPSELIESELFGHEKGAFTSACKQRKGKFEQAEGGTIFLDEIGDMSLSAQAKVLRALQECKITRVGSDKDIDVDVRVIAATNKNLKQEIANGNFREDLYHRIGVIELKVAPLRERLEDIPLLVDTFLHDICEEYHLDCKEISPEALETLMHMEWSGNIRQLRNIVERLIVLSDKRIEMLDVEENCAV